MDIVDAIYTRRSVRRFLDKPVEEAVIIRLIEAAAQAPSAMNTQPWAFAVVQDKQILRDISDHAKIEQLSTLDPLALEALRPPLEDPEYNIFYNAGSLVLILARPDVGPSPSTACTLAAENLMLMARSLGLGTCWIGFADGYLNTPEAKQQLEIPADYKVVAPLIVGYPEAEMAHMDREPAQIVSWKR